jgi:putative transposase
MPRIGTRKLKFLLDQLLCKHGITIGRDSLFELLAEYGLLVRRRKRRTIATTNSDHPFRKYPNLIRDLIPGKPEELWVSDITYIQLTNGFCYLSLVSDAWSRKIVGYCLYPNLKKEGPLTTLRMALSGRERKEGKSLIHHSDRGLQYCCTEYTDLLTQSAITISTTENGDPYENAIAERINGILKSEFCLDKPFKSYQQAHASVTTAVEAYNTKRPHTSLRYNTPQQAYFNHLNKTKMNQ